jgi:hypothetical protein
MIESGMIRNQLAVDGHAMRNLGNCAAERPKAKRNSKFPLPWLVVNQLGGGAVSFNIHRNTWEAALEIAHWADSWSATSFVEQVIYRSSGSGAGQVRSPKFGN